MLKKQIGAGFLSLAMLSGVGLHNTAFADPDPTTDYNITVNDGDGYDYGNPTATFTDGVNQDTENNIPATQPSSSANIRGWQTEEPEGYAVNVTWGDMVFVYDRGAYNTEDGTLSRADNTITGIEMGATDGQVNKWYGFDGTNNKVTVENLSTGFVSFTANATVNNSHQNVTTSFYTKYFSEALNAEEIAAMGLSGVSHPAGEGYLWIALPNQALTLMDPERSDDGLTVTQTDWATGDDGTMMSIYLNLTGTPDTSLTTDPTNLDAIGSITLTFAKVSD